MNRLIRLILSFFKWEFPEWFQEHCPIKIPTKKPTPHLICGECGKLMRKIIAYNTGDGWVFMWDCENGCQSDDAGEDLASWYPFWFDVWCSPRDLAKIGIEDV